MISLQFEKQLLKSKTFPLIRMFNNANILLKLLNKNSIINTFHPNTFSALPAKDNT